MKKTYSEKLKDPRWQKKRLEILERDGWRCRACGNDKETLVVHHIQYQKGKEPWDYSEDDLETLCELCHSTFHDSALHPDQKVMKVLLMRMAIAAMKGDKQKVIQTCLDLNQRIYQLKLSN